MIGPGAAMPRSRTFPRPNDRCTGGARGNQIAPREDRDRQGGGGGGGGGEGGEELAKKRQTDEERPIRGRGGVGREGGQQKGERGSAARLAPGITWLS